MAMGLIGKAFWGAKVDATGHGLSSLVVHHGHGDREVIRSRTQRVVGVMVLGRKISDPGLEAEDVEIVGQVDVPADRLFLGLEGFKNAIATDFHRFRRTEILRTAFVTFLDLCIKIFVHFIKEYIELGISWRVVKFKVIHPIVLIIPNLLVKVLFIFS